MADEEVLHGGVANAGAVVRSGDHVLRPSNPNSASIHSFLASKLGWSPADRPNRLRIICDAYGCDADARQEVLACLSESIARGGEFVRRRVEAGEVAFIEMWESMGGQERFDRRRRWWSTTQHDFEAALR